MTMMMMMMNDDGNALLNHIIRRNMQSEYADHCTALAEATNFQDNRSNLLSIQ